MWAPESHKAPPTTTANAAITTSPTANSFSRFTRGVLNELPDHGILRLLDLLHGTHLPDLALVQHGDTITDRIGAAHVVRHHDARHAEMLAGPHHELVDHRRGHGIEAGGRFVVQEVAGSQGDGARDAHPLAHPARQLGRVLLLRTR